MNENPTFTLARLYICSKYVNIIAESNFNQKAELIACTNANTIRRRRYSARQILLAAQDDETGGD